MLSREEAVQSLQALNRQLAEERDDAGRQEAERLRDDLEEQIKAECQERFNTVFRRTGVISSRVLRNTALTAKATADLQRQAATYDREVQRLSSENRALLDKIKQLSSTADQARSELESRVAQLEEALRRAEAERKTQDAQLALADRRLRDLDRRGSASAPVASLRPSSPRPRAMAAAEGARPRSALVASTSEMLRPTSEDMPPPLPKSVSHGEVYSRPSLPRGAGALFKCDDEEPEVFSSSYLSVKEGECHSAEWKTDQSL